MADPARGDTLALEFSRARIGALVRPGGSWPAPPGPPSLATTQMRATVARSTAQRSAASADRHLLALQLQPDLVLLQRGEEAPGAPAGAIGPSLGGIGHDQIVLHRSRRPVDAH
jgi:hypothetical protein